MAHTRLFDQLRRAFRIADLCEREGLSTKEGLERAEELKERRALTRRSVIKGAAVAAVAAAAGGRRAFAQTSGPRIAIIGAGLAGLVAADRLRAKGYAAVLYEANSHIGGRVRSMRGTFPGQVAEAGGELIDNLHKTMLAYANEFNLAREDLGKEPGENAYYFGGTRYSEAEVIDEYRQLVPFVRADLHGSSGAPTFFSHTAGDVALDQTDLATWLGTRGAGLPLIQKVLEQAYIAEYGLECSEQSSLNMLLFIHGDRASKFREFGVYSDERFHLVGGNDAIGANIRARLPGPVNLGAELVRLGKNAFGKYELYFRGGSVPELADAVIVTVPFSVLRRVTLDASLGLSADKVQAINTLGYGANAKTMIGFDGRPWLDQGSNGLVYADLANVQNTWETNYLGNTGSTTILTDYSGGNRGRALQVPPPPPGSTLYCNNCHNGPGGFFDIQDALIQSQVDAFLTDLDRVFPGSKARASRAGGKYVVRRGHWLPQPYSRGSYTCYLPGQFTNLCGLESQSAGALKFAGEHANSFYEWQGFMEGACLSGLAAANEVLDDIQHGRI
ncbi:MAG TPA: NAD(P)/FAD-dependent oxidoreductase [Myxococcales bacterium]|nr:NAD(P)/FAD-dependent oxidoreductase [Myxococcales bacterium]